MRKQFLFVEFESRRQMIRFHATLTISSHWWYKLGEASHAIASTSPSLLISLPAVGRRYSEKHWQWSANASSISCFNRSPKLKITQPLILSAWEDSLLDAMPARHTHCLHMQITSKAGCVAAHALSRAYSHAQPQPRHVPAYLPPSAPPLRALLIVWPRAHSRPPLSPREGGTREVTFFLVPPSHAFTRT